MEPITYSLKGDQPRSDAYYQQIAAFTDEVIAQAEDRLGMLLSTFETARDAHGDEHGDEHGDGREDRRTRPEYLFELLTLGVLWRVYAERALTLRRGPQRVLRVLARWRERGGWIKTAVDGVRGPLATLFLARGDHAALPEMALDPLDRLLGWLDAAGDFEQEVERLRPWQAFFAAQPDVLRDHAAAIRALADWFAARSLETLGSYTANVEMFLRDTLPGYRWREDLIFCGRQRIEYHLNMVGVVIMNRAFREAFRAAPHKIVLVPPCMRARSADDCQARETPFGAQCAGCEPRCHVHQVTKLGEKHGFAVRMLPDDLATYSPGDGVRAALADVAIVGISCPLTIVQGGWKTRALHIPAQGLPLDYCGCEWHWHLDGGIPTNVNWDELLRVVGAQTPPDSHGKI